MSGMYCQRDEGSCHGPDRIGDPIGNVRAMTPGCVTLMPFIRCAEKGDGDQGSPGDAFPVPLRVQTQSDSEQDRAKSESQKVRGFVPHIDDGKLGELISAKRRKPEDYPRPTCNGDP
jgi:hypothetical protein